MLNAHGRALIWILVVLLILLIPAAAGIYFAPSDGWGNSPSEVWAKILQTVPGGKPSAEEPAPAPEKLVERPPFPEAEEEQPAAETPEAQTPPMTQAALPPGAEAVPEAGTVVSTSSTNEGTPQSVLKACVEKLKVDDLVGAEQYVSDQGMLFSYRDTRGVHEILWKGLFKLHSYDEIGYDQVKIAGQTAWIPVYTRLGNTRMRTMLVLANRGDGWKLDRITDSTKF